MFFKYNIFKSQDNYFFEILAKVAGVELQTLLEEYKEWAGDKEDMGILADVLNYLTQGNYLHTRKASDEHASIKSIETAEDKYMTLYIVCFVISLNISDIITFFIVYFIVFLFVIKAKFSYFNPYLMLWYNFYEAEIENEKSANYKICLISKNTIKNDRLTNLIRLNDFVFLEDYKKEVNE